MQVNAISSVNNTPRFQGTNAGAASYEDRLEKFDAVVEKANQDVSPLTVALTSALSVAAIVKGKDKIVPLVRKTAIQAGEMISSGMVKFFGGIANKFKSGAFDANSSKILERITNAAESLRGEKVAMAADGQTPKLIETVGKILGNIVSEEKAQKITNFLENNGITNWVKAADAIIATLFVVPLADKFSDKVENICDDSKIRQAAEALEILAE